jgi:hypothetical protein
MANLKLKENADIKTGNNVSINVLPVTGHILPFAGPSNKIPTGWVLCDGTNGTPDLRGKLPGGFGNVAVNVGGTQTHSHTFTNTLGAFNNATVSDSANISSANTGNNSAGHTHGINGTFFFRGVWGDSGAANRATGTGISSNNRSHTHTGNFSNAVASSDSGQSANHVHGYNAYSVNATSSNAHGHSISSSPTANSQTLTHTSLPSIFYVNFIMKV